jgi:hypothetical protein
VLDPRISYDGLKMDYGDDPSLASHLEDSKVALFDYFEEHYAGLPVHDSTPPSPPSPPSSESAPPMDGSPQKSYMARYRRLVEKCSTNELEEYFKIPGEDLDACNPIQWWASRRSQFPRLYQLARDILCIPGKVSCLFEFMQLESELSQVPQLL